MSGDSDFSAMVIKLKEYGKYVIGVGIRESASDLLIQNCDEYFSYSDLAGLTKESDIPSIQRDPWELVGEAVEKMARSGDVMRSDRLKQVIAEGNVRRVVVKQEGQVVAEFPLTVGVVGTVLAPVLAAIGALAALLTRCTIEVERSGRREG